MCCSYTTLPLKGGKLHINKKRREQSAPARKTQPHTLPHTIPTHGGTGAWVTTTTAAAAATANIATSSPNVDNSSTAPKDDAETACWIAALLIPTRPKATERTRSEKTKCEKLDHREEAERQRAIVRKPPLEQLAQCKPTAKSSKNNLQQPDRKPHGQGRRQIIIGEKKNYALLAT
jgi:hypothetical protein